MIDIEILTTVLKELGYFEDDKHSTEESASETGGKEHHNDDTQP